LLGFLKKSLTKSLALKTIPKLRLSDCSTGHGIRTESRE